MGKKAQTYQRKNYFIKKEFQFKFILKFCLIMLAGIILSTCFVLYFSQNTLTSSFNNSQLVIETTSQAILPTIVITNLITLAIITLAAIIITLFISHRIAGPMFRFEKDIRQITKGDLTVRINLRQKDQFSEMAKAFNEMSSSLHNKVTQINEQIDKIMTMTGETKVIEEYDKQIKGLKKMIQKDFSL
ncbi:MAG: HAMP domain-containing protein [Desulfobacula sp.]|nr:HAMP domain-containing protein [Desulfobacula sp.]